MRMGVGTRIVFTVFLIAIIGVCVFLVCAALGVIPAVDVDAVSYTHLTRSALQNAASVSAMLLTTESIVTDIPSKEPPMAPQGGGMPGMY